MSPSRDMSQGDLCTEKPIPSEIKEPMQASCSRSAAQKAAIGKKRPRILLELEEDKKSGMLIRIGQMPEKVSILHISSAGDCLVNDGSNVMAITAACVYVKESEEVESFKRLQFIKKVYDAVERGEELDNEEILFQYHRWMS